MCICSTAGRMVQKQKDKYRYKITDKYNGKYKKMCICSRVVGDILCVQILVRQEMGEDRRADITQTPWTQRCTKYIKYIKYTNTLNKQR